MIPLFIDVKCISKQYNITYGFQFNIFKHMVKRTLLLQKGKRGMTSSVPIINQIKALISNGN